MRFFRIPSFTGIETHRDDADRGSLRVVEGCLPHGPGGLRSGPVWEEVGTVDLFSDNSKNILTGNDDGKGNSVVVASRGGRVHDMVVYSTENTALVSLGASYMVADSTAHTTDFAAITPVGGRMHSFGDGSAESVFFGKGPTGEGHVVFPDQELYTQEWSRFPNCKFFVQGPKKTLFGAGNPKNPLTIYISEPAGITKEFRDSPYSTEMTTQIPGKLSTVNILSSNASRITALSTRGDQVVVHTDKGCHLLYAPSSDQANTGYRVEQVSATNFAAAVNVQVVAGERGSQNFWLGFDGQIYKDESSTRGADDKKNFTDGSQASWKSKGLWEKELTDNLSRSFSTYDPQSGMYWLFTETKDFYDYYKDVAPGPVLGLRVSDVTPDTSNPPINLLIEDVQADPPNTPENLILTFEADPPNTPTNLELTSVPDAPNPVTDLEIAVPEFGPENLTTAVLAPVDGPESLSSSLNPPLAGPENFSGSLEVPVDGPSELSTAQALPVSGPGSLGAVTSTPLAGPSGLNADVTIPTSGPSNLDAIYDPSGPENLIATLNIPVSGPGSLSAIPNVPESGPSGLSASLQFGSAGPSNLNASLNVPVAGPGSLSASLNTPVSGPNGLSASLNSVVAGPSGLNASLNVPVSGPGSLNASINIPVSGPSTLSAVKLKPYLYEPDLNQGFSQIRYFGDTGTIEVTWKVVPDPLQAPGAYNQAAVAVIPFPEVPEKGYTTSTEFYSHQDLEYHAVTEDYNSDGHVITASFPVQSEVNGNQRIMFSFMLWYKQDPSQNAGQPPVVGDGLPLSAFERNVDPNILVYSTVQTQNFDLNLADPVPTNGPSNLNAQVLDDPGGGDEGGGGGGGTPEFVWTQELLDPYAAHDVTMGMTGIYLPGLNSTSGSSVVSNFSAQMECGEPLKDYYPLKLSLSASSSEKNTALRFNTDCQNNHATNPCMTGFFPEIIDPESGGRSKMVHHRVWSFEFNEFYYAALGFTYMGKRVYSDFVPFFGWQALTQTHHSWRLMWDANTSGHSSTHQEVWIVFDDQGTVTSNGQPGYIAFRGQFNDNTGNPVGTIIPMKKVNNNDQATQTHNPFGSYNDFLFGTATMYAVHFGTDFHDASFDRTLMLSQGAKACSFGVGNRYYSHSTSLNGSCVQDLRAYARYDVPNMTVDGVAKTGQQVEQANGNLVEAYTTP